MKKHIFAALFVLGTVGTAHAELIKGDWLTENDRQTVIDTNTGIEWLTLNNTSSRNPDHILLELGSGGQFEGWRVATQDEVSGLVDAFYEITPATRSTASGSTSSDAQAYADGTSWLGMMKGTDSFQERHTNYTHSYYESVGAIKNEQGRWTYTGVSRQGNSYQGKTSYYLSMANADVDTNPSARSYNYESTGVFLVSDGGLTLTSSDQPWVNDNNPNAPSNVTVGSFGTIGALSLMAGVGLFKRRRLGVSQTS